jgi:hypothetical protein
MPLPYHLETWGPAYLRGLARGLLARRTEARRLWVAITDHFEPYWRKAGGELALARVRNWVERWPEVAQRHPDIDGRPARYSFFYPAEEYHAGLMDRLAALCQAGYGDVEVHLHHDRDTESAFLDRMGAFVETLHARHGLLRKVDGRIAFGFIHGNWCLDNSGPDGRWCGLNNEISLLRGLGCYADFTMPCGPLPMQARMLNEIYWATDDPAKPKSYDRGTPARPGAGALGDLLMIPGPFGLRWEGRLKPFLDIGEIGYNQSVTPARVRFWLRTAPRIGADVFLKLFAHGTQERHSSAFFGGGLLDTLYASIRQVCEDDGIEYRFATAFEMWRAVTGLTAAGGGLGAE